MQNINELHNLQNIKSDVDQRIPVESLFKIDKIVQEYRKGKEENSKLLENEFPEVKVDQITSFLLSNIDFEGTGKEADKNDPYYKHQIRDHELESQLKNKISQKLESILHSKIRVYSPTLFEVNKVEVNYSFNSQFIARELIIGGECPGEYVSQLNIQTKLKVNPYNSINKSTKEIIFPALLPINSGDKINAYIFKGISLKEILKYNVSLPMPKNKEFLLVDGRETEKVNKIEKVDPKNNYNILASYEFL